MIFFIISYSCIVFLGLQFTSWDNNAIALTDCDTCWRLGELVGIHNIDVSMLWDDRADM